MIRRWFRGDMIGCFRKLRMCVFEILLILGIHFVKLLLIKILVVRMLLIITRYPSYNIVGESDANPVRL